MVYKVTQHIINAQP